MRLEGKVAIVSGAASGMGAATARRFAKEGAKVVVADMLEEEGRQVAADITRANGTAEFMRLDVTSEDDWKAVVDATVQKYGKLDILVNNAGISGSAVTDMLDTEAWDRLMAVNSRGVFLGTKHAVLGDEAGRRRIDRQPVVDLRRDRADHDAYGLQRVERRGAHADQIHRGAVRPRRHPRQFRPSRTDAADAHVGRDGRSRRCARRCCKACRCAAPARSTRWPTRYCSWPRTRRRTSRALNSMSMAATSPHERRVVR